MQKTRKPVELLAPAGNFEKLEMVLHYGADAVYLAGKEFSLRNFAENFTMKELSQALALAHAHGAKVYVAVNIFARNCDLDALDAYLHALGELQPDGIIAADPAVISIARKTLPKAPIHISTQANTTNAEAVRFWKANGAVRINLARELTLQEIAQISAQCDIELEAFVHGAMCISYSGRCLLSNFMARRPSNQGMCCQPCRFQYAVVEETRPGQYFPVLEDEKGTYIFNSKDLCMLAYIPMMLQAGIASFKIEGRMKGINYAATAVKIYREAIDSYYRDPQGFQVMPYWQEELEKITSRGYCTGFYLDDPEQFAPRYAPPRLSESILLAKVLAPAGHHRAHIDVRNRIHLGDRVEILTRYGPAVCDKINRITNDRAEPVQIAQPGQRVTVDLTTNCVRFDLLRRASS
jgi:putative protease